MVVRIFPDTKSIIEFDKIHVLFDYVNHGSIQNLELTYMKSNGVKLFNQTHKLFRTDFIEGTTSISLDRIKEIILFYIPRIKSENFIKFLMKDKFLGDDRLIEYGNDLITGGTYADEYKLLDIDLIKVKSDGVYFYALQYNDNQVRDFIKYNLPEEMHEYLFEYCYSDSDIQKVYAIELDRILYVNRKYEFSGGLTYKLDLHPVMKLDIKYFEKLIEDLY